jgi:iron complex transport system substrate-binding protein
MAADSWLRSLAVGLPIRRADSESALAARPQVVVRYWGGDAGLTAELTRRGAVVVTIDDAVDFAGVRANVRRVARALDAVEAGEGLLRRMDDRLAEARGAWGGAGVVYLTSGGATAAGGTLIDSILRAAGMRNLSRGLGYREVSLERLELDPPRAVVAALSRLLGQRPTVFLPGALLGCPAWFAGEAVSILACRAPSRQGDPRCA